MRRSRLVSIAVFAAGFAAASIGAEAKNTSGNFAGTIGFKAKTKLDKGPKFSRAGTADVELELVNGFWILRVTTDDGVSLPKTTTISGVAKCKRNGTVTLLSDEATITEIEDITDALLGAVSVAGSGGTIDFTSPKRFTGTFDPGKNGSGRLTFGTSGKGKSFVNAGDDLTSGKGSAETSAFGTLRTK